MAAPKNPHPYKGEKLWRSAIQRAVNRRLEGKGSPKALEQLADKCVAMALKGDIQAMKEIGDRLDGRANQSVSATIDDTRDPKDYKPDLEALLAQLRAEEAAKAKDMAPAPPQEPTEPQENGKLH